MAASQTHAALGRTGLDRPTWATWLGTAKQHHEQYRAHLFCAKPVQIPAPS